MKDAKQKPIWVFAENVEAYRKATAKEIAKAVEALNTLLLLEISICPGAECMGCNIDLGNDIRLRPNHDMSMVILANRNKDRYSDVVMGRLERKND